MTAADTPISLFPRYLTPAAAASVAEAEAADSIPYTLTARGTSAAELGESPAREPEPRSVRDAWDAHLHSQRGTRCEAEWEAEAGQ
jgi:hypothetical protein